MTWDTATAGPPLLLNDTTSSYLYGPRGAPLEQIQGSTPTYRPTCTQINSTPPC